MKRTSFFAVALLTLGLHAPLGFAQQPDQNTDPATPSVETTTTTEQATGEEPKAPAQVPDAAVQERIAFLLSGYEYFPTRADLDAVAKPDVVVAVLIGFAKSEDARTTQRMRAVDALGHYDTDASVEYLSGLVDSTIPDDAPRKHLRTRSLMKHHAITALARARKEAAVPKIAPMLAAEDVQLRLTAIDALGKHGGATGKAALTALKKTETNDFVQRELRKWVR